jgi:hypothetical protein
MAPRCSFCDVKIDYTVEYYVTVYETGHGERGVCACEECYDLRDLDNNAAFRQAYTTKSKDGYGRKDEFVCLKSEDYEYIENGVMEDRKWGRC